LLVEVVINTMGCAECVVMTSLAWHGIHKPHPQHSDDCLVWGVGPSHRSCVEIMIC